MTKYFFMDVESPFRFQLTGLQPAAAQSPPTAGISAKSGGRGRAERDDYGGLMQSLHDKFRL